jgi:hypothetical protein
MGARVFANDGGPLIALDASHATFWEGGTDPDEESDYKRACEAGYPAGLVPVETTAAAVIGAEEGLATARWIHSPEGHLFLVGCAFADDDVDEDLPRLLKDGAAWMPLGRIAVASGKLLLFHAACQLTDLRIDPDRDVAVIGDALSAIVEPGEYSLAARELALPNKALFNFVRWTRA